MAGMYQEVLDYLDMNAVFVDDKIAPFDIPKLEIAFPGVDSATLDSCLKDWLHARETINKLTAELF
jgi:hypothetical protein